MRCYIYTLESIVDNSQILFEMLKKVDEKLDSHTETLARLEVITEQNKEDIKYHIKRTDLLEEKVELNKKSIEKRLESLEQPSVVSKFLSSKLLQISGLTAAIYGLINFFKYIKTII